MRYRALAAGIVSCITMFAAGQASANPINIVQNPGFEDNLHGLTSWTVSPMTQNGWYSTWYAYDGGHSGSYKVGSNCGGGYVCTLSQNLTTVAGSTYDLSFWMLDGFTPDYQYQDLQVKWNGALVDNITRPGTSNAWKQVTISNLTAISTSTSLWFGAATNFSLIMLDDVSVTAKAATLAVPEPTTIALLGTGLLGLYFVRRHATQRATKAL